MKIKVYTGTYPSEISWTLFEDFGNNDNKCTSSNYYYTQDYTDNCGTLLKRRYRLYCYDSYGDGWNGAFIKLVKDGVTDSTEYCKDFISGTSHFVYVTIT